MFIDQQAFLAMPLNQVQRQVQCQRCGPGSSFGSQYRHDSAFYQLCRLALGPCCDMRQRVRNSLRLKRLHQIFRKSRPHGGHDLLRVRARRGGEDSQAVVAAIAKPLANAAAILHAFIKIDHADAMLKWIQHFHGFAGSNVPIDIIHDVSAGGLQHQDIQALPRAGIHADAQDADALFGPARTL